MSLPLPADADYYRSLSSLHLEVERQRLMAIVDRIGVQMEVIERLGQNPEWLRMGRARRVGAYAHLALIKEARKQVRMDEKAAAKQARIAAGLAKHQAEIAKHQERKAAQKAARAEAAKQRAEAEAAKRKAQVKENKRLAEKRNVAERARKLAEERINEYRNTSCIANGGKGRLEG